MSQKQGRERVLSIGTLTKKKGHHRMGGKPSPDRRAVAKMVVLRKLGKSDRSIGREVGCHHKTVSKYLSRQEMLQDPEVTRLVELIKKTETADAKTKVTFALTEMYAKWPTYAEYVNRIKPGTIPPRLEEVK